MRICSQLLQFAVCRKLRFIGLNRNRDAHFGELVALRAIRLRPAAAAQPEYPPGSRAWWQRHYDVARQGRNRDVSSEDRSVVRHVDADADVVAVKPEDRMRTHAKTQDQVATARCLVPQPQATSVAATGGDSHRERLPIDPDRYLPAAEGDRHVDLQLRLHRWPDRPLLRPCARLGREELSAAREAAAGEAAAFERPAEEVLEEVAETCELLGAHGTEAGTTLRTVEGLSGAAG